MGWASKYIQALQKGEVVKFRPHGNSMTPKVHNGDLCTVAPIGSKPIERGGSISL